MIREKALKFTKYFLAIFRKGVKTEMLCKKFPTNAKKP
jgi:hypothetical protein